MRKAPHTISVLAPAKVNLAFDIIGMRPDNYHEILTLFQTLALQDRLTFQIFPGENNFVISECKSECINTALFPMNDENLIIKAIKLFVSNLHDAQPIDIEIKIEKNIPIGAGLAGGSSNAAAALFALNHYFNKPFSEDKLIALSALIGSDVPFCLMGGLAIGSGRGEILEKVDQQLDYHFVLIKPKSLSISTPWAFSFFDQQVNFLYPDKQKTEASLHTLIAQLNVPDLNISVSDRPIPAFWNCFETAMCKEFPLLNKIKTSLLELGCLQAHLTGSGPTIYGLVKNEEHGQSVLKRLLASNENQERELLLDGWLTKAINSGTTLVAQNALQGSSVSANS